MGAPAFAVAELLEAVQTAVWTLAERVTGTWSATPGADAVHDETTLWLVSLTADEPVEVRMQFVRAPSDLLIDPDDADDVLVARVLEHVVAGLEGERDVPELASLCRLVVEHAHGLTVTAVMAGGDRRTVDVERGVAQRLSAADAP